MRSDVHVGSQLVLAVVLADVEAQLSHPLARIRLAITRGNFGYTRITKDFLTPGAIGPVKRGVNNRRRKCEAISFSSLDTLKCAHIKSGK